MKSQTAATEDLETARARGREYYAIRARKRRSQGLLIRQDVHACYNCGKRATEVIERNDVDGQPFMAHWCGRC